MKKLVSSISIALILSSALQAKETTIVNGLDLGPLAKLVGTWKTVKDGGIDVAPDQNKKGENAVSPYYEVMTFEVAADAKNANNQYLTALYYKQEVFRKADNKKFHDERGYYIYDKVNSKVYNSFCVPRTTCITAEGEASDNMTLISKDKGIAQSEFMTKNASTTGFKKTINITKDTLTYNQTILLDIYGSKMTHTDTSTLKKIK
jgi:hypothetical protein